MKKIALIISLFLCLTNVFALETKFAGSEFLEGISYMKYDGKTHYYRNAQVIRNTSTNEIAYCVEPFGLLIDNTSYTVYDSYTSIFGINNKLWEKIKLYAYYGYGYKNHTDKKWISITQLSIWKEMYPEYQFEWIDNTTSRNIIHPYNNELNELKNLVNNHYKTPSFDILYETSINSSLELKDDNNVLQYYKIKSSDFDSSISGNSLLINTDNEVKEGKIILEKISNNYSNSVLYFYSSSSQNLMARGKIEPVTMEINVKTYSGSVVINKVSNEEIINDASIDGAIFDLFDEDMSYIKSIEIKDGIAVIDDLSFGKYFIKESKPGRGYYLNENIYEFTIDVNNLEANLTIDNTLIKSKIKIIKYYGSRNDYKENKMKREENVSFNIYDDKDNIVYSGVTDSNGEINLSLPYGKYVIKQINSKEGYQINDDYWFEINEESSYSLDIPLYDFEIKTYNAGLY